MTFYPAFVDKFDGFSLDMCRLKDQNEECVSFNATYNGTENTLVKVEFMQWMHICTTFEIYEKDLITTTYHAVSKTYINGKRVEKQGISQLSVPAC